MRSQEKYDPEDIESLMLHKQFHELYPEEKEFVLRHLESEDEYESMRSILIEIKDSFSNEEGHQPDRRIKSNLMKEFSTSNQRGITIWLNSLFVSDIPFYKRPATIVLAAIFVGVLFFILSPSFFNSNFSGNSNEIAQSLDLTKDTLPVDAPPPTESLAIDTSNANVLPAAVKPVVLAMIEGNQMEITEDVPTESSDGSLNDGFSGAAPTTASAPDVVLKEESSAKKSLEADMDNLATIASTTTLSNSPSVKSVSIQMSDKESAANTSVNMKRQLSLLDRLFTAR